MDHLLAGHGVEGETRPDFGHALRAFGYDEELHDGQDEEDHRADHKVAAKANSPNVKMISPASA